MKRPIMLVMFVLTLLLSGCEALRMSPDAWLHPPRWRQREAENIQEGPIRTVNSQQLQTLY